MSFPSHLRLLAMALTSLKALLEGDPVTFGHLAVKALKSPAGKSSEMPASTLHSTSTQYNACASDGVAQIFMNIFAQHMNRCKT